MNTTNLNPAIHLDSILKQMKSDLHRYTQSSNAKQPYIDKQNKLIEELETIKNTINYYNNHALLTTIQHTIDELKTKDTEIENYIIRVIKNKKSLRTAMITINP